ncbi:MAG: DUF202 domain-containing protein [Mycobacterium sp.]
MVRQKEVEPDYCSGLANERAFPARQRTALSLLAAAVGLLRIVSGLVVHGVQYPLGSAHAVVYQAVSAQVSAIRGLFLTTLQAAADCNAPGEPADAAWVS